MLAQINPELLVAHITDDGSVDATDHIYRSPTTGKQEGQLAQLHSHRVTVYWLHCLVPPAEPDM